METRRLQLLLELSRLGSMRAVADALGTTTSSVSQQIAVLARETGAQLLEPDGRRVRLTPAGHRLADHAATILAAVEAAHADLLPGAEPSGTLHIAGFATAIRRAVLPAITEIARSHPSLTLILREHEPAEAFALLAADSIDLALTYDYNLAPAAVDSSLEARALWTTPWGLGVPAGTAQPAVGRTTPEVFKAFRGSDWIGNSRNRADEDVVRTLAAIAGFEPRITHQIDSLELVEELIVAGLGVGLLPAGRPVRPGIALIPLSEPTVVLRSYAVTRRGRAGWPPLALMLSHLASGRDDHRRQDS
jgi:DNA-binding transcriptional LysR family regulator